MTHIHPSLFDGAQAMTRIHPSLFDGTQALEDMPIGHGMGTVKFCPATKPDRPNRTKSKPGVERS